MLCLILLFDCIEVLLSLNLNLFFLVDQQCMGVIILNHKRPNIYIELIQTPQRLILFMLVQLADLLLQHPNLVQLVLQLLLLALLPLALLNL